VKNFSSEIIGISSLRHEEEKLHNIFNFLTQEKYLIRAEDPQIFFGSDEEKTLTKEHLNANISTDEVGEDHILWMVNGRTFDLEFAYEYLVEYITEKFDDQTAKTFGHLLSVIQFPRHVQSNTTISKSSKKQKTTEPLEGKDQEIGKVHLLAFQNLFSLSTQTSLPFHAVSIAEQMKRQSETNIISSSLSAAARTSINNDNTDGTLDLSQKGSNSNSSGNSYADCAVQCLELLSKQHKPPLIYKVGTPGPPSNTVSERLSPTQLVVLQFENIREIVLQRVIESVVVNKFGTLSGRIFRLLNSRPLLEQKQIASICMIPIKDVREKLYRMLNAGFVALQEIPKSSDHAPVRTFYLWSIPPQSQLRTILSSDICKAILNMKLKAGHITQQHRDILHKAQEAPWENPQNQHLWSPEERDLFTKLQHGINSMETAVLQMDATLLTLHI
jgi:hypothetical protein